MDTHDIPLREGTEEVEIRQIENVTVVFVRRNISPLETQNTIGLWWLARINGMLYGDWVQIDPKDTAETIEVLAMQAKESIIKIKDKQNA